jgi:hypothetical protein
VSAADATGAHASGHGPFTARGGILLALVGVFSFCALAVLGAYAPDLRMGNDGGAHALSRSAIGFAGIVEAMKLSGDPAFVNRGPLPETADQGLLVVTPTPATRLEDVLGLKFAGTVLIVLPKWFAPPDPTHKGWVGKGVVIDAAWTPKSSLLSAAGVAHAAGASRPILRAVDTPFANGATFTVGPIDRLQTIGAKRWDPVLVDGTGAAVLARDPDQPIFLLADPDLIDTQGLKNPDTLGGALAILRTLRRGEGPVMFDVRLNGFGRERSLLRLMLEPPLLAVTLSLAVAAALAGFQAACRFGPTIRPPPAFAFGKQALVDNSAALIRLAGREHRMGGRYADLALEQAARAVGAPRDLRGDDLVAFLDRLAARRGALDRLGPLIAAARAAPDRHRVAALAQSLYRWKLEMTRDPG